MLPCVEHGDDRNSNRSNRLLTIESLVVAPLRKPKQRKYVETVIWQHSLDVGRSIVFCSFIDFMVSKRVCTLQVLSVIATVSGGIGMSYPNELTLVVHDNNIMFDAARSTVLVLYCLSFYVLIRSAHQVADFSVDVMIRSALQVALWVPKPGSLGSKAARCVVKIIIRYLIFLIDNLIDK